MKKFFYIWLFLASFFIFSQDVFAEEITDGDYLQECLTSTEDSLYSNNCLSFGIGTARYDSSKGEYISESGVLNRSPGLWLDFGSVYTSDVEVGPPTTYPSFAFFVGTGGFDKDSYGNSLLTYHLVKELPYKLVYTFFLNRSVDFTDFSFNFDEEDPNFLYHAKAVNIEKDTLYDEDVFSKFYVNTSINTETRYVTIEFSFVPKDNFDEFGFYVGNDNFNNVDSLQTRFISNFSTETQPLQYIDFKLYQTGELDDSGTDIIHVDKPTEDDVFSGFVDLTEGVNSCDGVDVGCWFNNLWIVLKNLLFNIGKIFFNILNYFWKVIDFAINLLLQPLKSLVNFVLIFWEDFVSFLQNSLKWFYDTFFKGPFDFFIESITSFFIVDVNDINVLLEQLNDSISLGDNSLSSIVTKPLEIIQNLSNSYCTNVTFTLPLVNSTFSLPCMTPIYQTYFNSLFVLYQTLTTGIIAYCCLINLLAFVMDFKEPTGDKVEVLNL